MTERLDENHQEVLIAICITTFRRDAGLQALLVSIESLDGVDTFAPVVVVADNDGSGDARDICADWSSRSGIRSIYALEPQRGISSARNKALSEVPDHTKFIAFIDDDEAVDHGWLREMLLAVDAHPADVWNGPVIPIYPKGTPSWVIRGRFHERPRLASGTERDRANTGNVMFRSTVLQRVGHWFDPKFGRSGGEDDDFFGRVKVAGATIVWVDEAVALETLGTQRVTARWILRRAYQFGFGSTLIRIDRGSPVTTRLVASTKACVRIVLAPFCVVAGVVRIDWGVKALASAARGFGALTAVIGRGYEGY